MRETRMEKVEGLEPIGRVAAMPEVCERAWNNVRESMKHVPGSAFYLPADRGA